MTRPLQFLAPNLSLAERRSAHGHVRWTCRQRDVRREESESSKRSGGARRKRQRGAAGQTVEAQTSRGRGRGRKRAALYDAMTVYSEHFMPLLTAEAGAEQAEYAASVKAPSLLHGVRASRRPRVLGQAVFVVEKPGRGEKLGKECRISKGDIVIVHETRKQRDKASGQRTPGQPKLDEEGGFEASVMERDLYGIKLAVPIGSDAARALESFEASGLLLSLEQGVNALATERAIAAVANITNSSRSHPEVSSIIVRSFAGASESEEAELASRVSPTKQGVMRNGGDEKNNDRNPWEEFARCAPPGLGKAVVSDTVRSVCGVRIPPNASQRTAVKLALSRTLSIIQGPPGTGKTVTAAAVVVGAVMAGSGPVLATAASNVAVDNLMEKVLRLCRELRQQMRFVRLGRVAAVQEGLWDHTLEAMLERDSRVRCAREQAEKAPQASDLAAAVYNAEREAEARIIGNADIVFATCVGAGREILANRSFRFLLCDEATQATEPDVLIPLTASPGDSLQQLVLVGDHHQLPPTVLSRVTQTASLSRSLFSRLWFAGVTATMLDTQYRMHPDIARFPARHFYFGKLRTCVRLEQRPLPMPNLRGTTAESVLENLRRSRTVFLDVTNGREEQQPLRDERLAHSYSNRAEAENTIRVVESLPFAAEEIGVISPYAAQVRLLSQMLAENGAYGLVEVNSVDGFQGREKTAIVFSAVRSNTQGHVGFLADWRRLNVALTRARSALVVVGNYATLRHDPHWAAWLRQTSQLKASEVVDQNEAADIIPPP